nr:immunoglobulin light chain junction region [Macaca mulatta]MOX47793.1 immunoglobulin light chain junction region [Macaca mulatta]MOX47846.1 immunoglobulin light chain junction region [Macaca mulatta]MOX47916.1 immunoglobulin light chain junction region [Macaca mulatta]MOX47942.1 immunoglobulin light chain junction region [Macaca mulatta]
CFQYYSGWTF